MTARLAVLISGNGSNLQVILDAAAAGSLDAEVVLVVSNRKAAYGLERAAQAGVPTLYFPLKPYLDAGKPRSDYDRDLAARISGYAPDFIVLAGWMHILDSTFIDQFPSRMINLHPALPGQFAGADAIRRTFEAYQRGATAHGGCMVHYVVPEVDAGAVILEATVPIHPYDLLGDFEARMHAVEHQLIVDALRLLVADSSNRKG